MLGIDAARPQKEQLLDALHMRRADDVRFDGDVLVGEVGRIAIIGQNAADPRGGHDDRVRPFGRHPPLGIGLALEVQLAVRGSQDLSALGGQSTHERGSHHAAVAGDPYTFALKRIDHRRRHS